MEPLASADVDANAIAAALEAEAQYERIWLPPEPWWTALIDDKANFAAAIHRQLLRGVRWPRSAIVDARKPGHGMRPISVMSPDVRVRYRAIVSALVPEAERADRSAERYAEFVMEPVRAAYNHEKGPKQLSDSKFTHVLVTDIAAFFQYIDHGVLRDELDLAGRDIQVVDGLVGLLADVEGRSFGVPQRSAPSDWLSEIYAARVERFAIREGFDVWRYSDDFRVGCTSYSEALRAIESLSRAARDVGLTLNDQKTATPSFLTYFGHNADVEVDDVSAEIDPSDVEAAVSSDYVPGDDDQAIAEAAEVFEHLWDPDSDDQPAGEEDWDLRNLTADQHRAVRRALNTLTEHFDASAMPRLASILVYQPAMTYRVISYAEAMAAVDEPMKAFFDFATTRPSLNEWQRAWVAYGIRVCAIRLTARSVTTRWLETQLAARPDSLAAAEAAVTLSAAKLLSFSALESLVRSVSADFAPWYLQSIANLRSSGIVSEQQVGALRQGSSFAHAILK
jgi:hypothetical protein